MDRINQHQPDIPGAFVEGRHRSAMVKTGSVNARLAKQAPDHAPSSFVRHQPFEIFAFVDALKLGSGFAFGPYIVLAPGI